MSVKLPFLFSDGMVLQRNAKIKLWGIADEPVTVGFMGCEYHADPDMKGNWEIVLNNLEPGGPYTMTINEIEIKDVYIGDVWLCAGQSNMQLPMQRVRHRYPEHMHAFNPNIRQFTVPHCYNFKGPMNSLDGGSWVSVSQETIKDFSAVGYFFSKRLQDRYQVPIGLIVAAIGGTPIHMWVNRRLLKNFPELLSEAERALDDTYVTSLVAKDALEEDSFFEWIEKFDPGLLEKWYLADYNDSDWEERDLLLPWKGAGSVWLRKTVEIPEELAGKPATIFLGTVIDRDTVYVNGEAIGNTTYRYPPREYVIPSLPHGRCTITIHAISKDGGCFTPGKQYLLTTDAGSFNLNDTWRFRPGVQGAPPAEGDSINSIPSGYYNAMIAPLRNFAIKGAIWYQGEADEKNPQGYAEKFTALVHGWRKDWGYEFPFIFVELPYWGGGLTWNELRRDQWQLLEIPKTAMAAAFDLGEHNDLHPLGKQAVGDRLARCAMRVAYGEKMPHSPFEIVGYSPGHNIID